MAKPTQARIYQLKITLMGSKPPIWRRLLVSSATTLELLHAILLRTMGWGGGHMHQFEGPDGTQYGCPEPDMDYHVTDEARVRLDRVLRGEKQSMLYLYDFGDSWEHKVVVEKILDTSEGLAVPSASAASAPVRPTIAAASGDMRISWRRSATLRIPSTRGWSNGSVANSILKNSIR